jgi:hypothetical protein
LDGGGDVSSPKKAAGNLVANPGLVAVAGVVVSAIGVASNVINSGSGGLTVTSEQASFPVLPNSFVKTQGTSQTTPTKCITFHSDPSVSNVPILDTITAAANLGRTRYTECHTELTLFVDVGETIMAQLDSGDVEKVPLIQNAFIKKTKTTDYAGGQFGSLLTFMATAMRQRVGSLADPKIRFSCEGRFDPQGAGDCQYTFFLDVDKFGQVSITGAKITAGAAKLTVTGGHIYIEVT